jgi:diaminopimelate epimerase
VASDPLAYGARMKGTVFYKMTGSGNDFVVLDGRSTTPDLWPGPRISALCDRRDGVGADGLVILTPEDADAVRMTFFNSDGSRAAMCGNAALCSTRLAAHLELGPSAGMRLLTDAGEVEARCLPEAARAEIRLPDALVPKPVSQIRRADGERAIWVGTVGVPHLVVLVDDVATVDVVGRGRPLRFDAAGGPDGANVNFISHLAEPGAPWLIRTFERGVEGETLACGTGTVAAALALAAHCGVALPLEFRSWGGQLLMVRATLQDDMATEVWLGGQGRLVFRGVWEG